MDTTDKLLEERLKTHGSFATHAKTTQELKRVLRHHNKFTDWVMSDEHKEALEMIMHKVGRIMAGNADFVDHWDDIAGYAKLGSQACKTKSSS